MELLLGWWLARVETFSLVVDGGVYLGESVGVFACVVGAEQQFAAAAQGCSYVCLCSAPVAAVGRGHRCQNSGSHVSPTPSIQDACRGAGGVVVETPSIRLVVSLSTSVSRGLIRAMRSSFRRL